MYKCAGDTLEIRPVTHKKQRLSPWMCGENYKAGASSSCDKMSGINLYIALNYTGFNHAITEIEMYGINAQLIIKVVNLIYYFSALMSLCTIIHEVDYKIANFHVDQIFIDFMVWTYFKFRSSPMVKS